jgi:hypothetical protein
MTVTTRVPGRERDSTEIVSASVSRVSGERRVAARGAGRMMRKIWPAVQAKAQARGIWRAKERRRQVRKRRRVRRDGVRGEGMGFDESTGGVRSLVRFGCCLEGECAWWI